MSDADRPKTLNVPALFAIMAGVSIVTLDISLTSTALPSMLRRGPKAMEVRSVTRWETHRVVPSSQVMPSWPSADWPFQVSTCWRAGRLRSVPPKLRQCSSVAPPAHTSGVSATLSSDSGSPASPMAALTRTTTPGSPAQVSMARCTSPSPSQAIRLQRSVWRAHSTKSRASREVACSQLTPMAHKNRRNRSNDKA